MKLITTANFVDAWGGIYWLLPHQCPPFISDDEYDDTQSASSTQPDENKTLV